MGMLDGKAVLVTGGATGLGRAHALAVAAAGARVVVNDVDPDGADAVVATIRSNSGQAVAHKGSVSDYDAADDMVQLCREVYGSIDGLVSNAGIFHRAAPALEDEARMREIVEVNILGSLFCGVHAFNAMCEQGQGAIVNTTSGSHLGIPGATSYGTTKGAVSSLTYNLAIEGYDRGVRVNALSPVAHTAMAIGQPAPPPGKERPEPEAISPAVVFLLSDLAAGITGQTLRFDGKAMSFMVSPHFRGKSTRTADWSAEGIARLYETDLTDERRPVGLAANITFVHDGA